MYGLMESPPSLLEGGTIGVVSLSSPVESKKVERGLELLRRRGFQIKTGKTLLKRRGYVAGSAQERAQDLLEFWNDPEIHAIWCTRGGYGVTQLFPYLPPRLPPKIFIGCSDLTLFLLYLQKQGHWAFHGPLLAGDQIHHLENQEAIFNLLMEQGFPSSYFIEGAEIFQRGSTRGKVTGGNLTLICNSLGTPYEIETQDRLLFLEDVGEKLYRIDRMFYHLYLAGKWKGVRGVLLGDFERCGEKEEQRVFFQEFFKQVLPEIPVVYGLKTGHGKWNMVLPLGAEMALEAQNLAELRWFS
jgi:muramoyltetrapeptide carboxypeptidase